MRPQVVLSARGYVLFDDSVFDKHHRRRIALVRRQYSGNAHGAIASIGLVTCVCVNSETDRFWLVDCLPPLHPRRGRQDYARARGQDAAPRGITCRTGLMDSWYATTAQFKWLLAAGKTFYCPLKSNRLVDDSGDQQPYQPVGCLNWLNAEVEGGKTLKEKGMPRTAN